MVCLYCGKKTIVKNSRYQKGLVQTWRRRQCLNCQSILTSVESYDISSGLRVLERDGVLQPFIKEILFLSIYTSVDHLENPAETAAHLTNTVLRHLIKVKPLDPTIESNKIIQITARVLKRFNAAASIKYLSYRTQMKLPNDVRRSLSS